MKTISVTCKSDQDAASLMTQLQTDIKFQDHVEILMIDEEISDEHLDEFDSKLEAFYDQPWEENEYIRFQKEVKDSFDITFVIREPK